MDIAVGGPRFDLGLDFHGWFFLLLKIGADYWALAADMNIPIGGASFHVRFDFHVFPFYEKGVNCKAIARRHPGRRADQLSRPF